MAVREVLRMGHPVLREKAKKVSKVTPAIQRLLDDMTETMRAAPGSRPRRSASRSGS